jgi:hypothetical protein
LEVCIVFLLLFNDYLFRLEDNDDHQSEKRLSDDAISAATGLLSTTPANGIIHSSKNAASSLRQRVRFKPSEGEGQHSHSHSHHHEHT